MKTRFVKWEMVKSIIENYGKKYWSVESMKNVILEVEEHIKMEDFKIEKNTRKNRRVL